MPTAERRAKQKLAKAKAAAATATAAAQAKTAESSTMKAAQADKQTRNKATPTDLDPFMLEALIQRYWGMLDRQGIDQATQPLQFIIGSSSSALTSISKTCCTMTTTAKAKATKAMGLGAMTQHKKNLIEHPTLPFACWIHWIHKILRSCQVNLLAIWLFVRQAGIRRKMLSITSENWLFALASRHVTRWKKLQS